MKNKIKYILITIILIGVLGGYFYVNDYYVAENYNISGIDSSDLEIISKDESLIVKPKNPEVGFIFYPGGKVEHLAYESLMVQIASKDILTIVPKMPFNLAVFNINAADEIIENYPEINHWYIGGHSLGGSMAARYSSKNREKIEGLILLGSYSTSDLKNINLKVLSIYGNNDEILNLDSYEKNKSNLPNDYKEVIIEGGNHAGFGNYGIQKGDGSGEITPETQQELTAEIIYDFINN